MDGPDNGREHASTRIPGAGVDGIGRCTRLLSDHVCRFRFLCVYVIMVFIMAQGRRGGCAKDGMRNGVRLGKKVTFGGWGVE